MLKKTIIIGALIAGLTLLLVTLSGLFGPQASSLLGPGGHFGYNSTWNAPSWSWVLFSGLARLVAWILPVLLITWLVSLLFQPSALKDVEQSIPGGES